MPSNHSELLGHLALYEGHPRRTEAETRVAMLPLTDVCGAFAESQQNVEHNEHKLNQAINEMRTHITRLENHRRVRGLLHEATVRALGAPLAAPVDGPVEMAEPVLRRAMHLLDKKVDA